VLVNEAGRNDQLFSVHDIDDLGYDDVNLLC
jgi:hypothetical protein